ncbi:exopolysaccharide biosynthesis polyprenyl glycosylphosphotransferase [Lachnospiraceae bacterium XBB2008]|nr:exopolysaccharide biosynthesis polyprenyl glycosylphosphotransferase [Lachnospiraceae bacterium XBB2008]
MKNHNGLEKKYIYRGFCTAILAVLVTAMFFFVWYRFAEENNQTGHLLGYGNLLMSAGIYIAVYLFIGRALKAFRIGVDRKANLLASEALTLFLLNALETLISCAVTGQFRFFPDFLWRYALLFLVQLVVTCVLTNYMVNLYRHIFPPYQVLEICKTEDEMSHAASMDADRKIRFMNDRPDKYHIAEVMSVDGGLEAIFDKLDDFDAVLINDIPSEIKNDILKECFNRDIRVYFTPKISDIISKNSEDINLFDTPLYLCRNAGIKPIQLMIKRVCDCIIAVLGLIITSPIFLVVAIAIKREDHGPVFYRQKRVTIGGRVFEMLKFRSMIVDAEKDGRPRPAGEDDDRITKVGHRIRPVRIDELPQLINILRGDMSVVGPRPERVEHVAKYTEEIPEFVYRLKVKGGLTGPAQVFGRYNTDALNKLKMDLFYITNYSILLDLQILFETIKILVQKESTAGFSEARQEEMHDL